MRRLARVVDENSPGGEALLVGVLTGAYVLTADLAREAKTPCRIAFVRAASYGSGTESSGEVLLDGLQGLDITGRDVFLVEDIVDTGRTLEALKEAMLALSPASLRVLALVDKRARRSCDIHIDAAAFVLEENLFLVGFGMDAAGLWRDLQDIRAFRE